MATSRRQLQRAFAEAGETSFRSYLQRVRMERAAELLREGPTPVNQVASAVGYRQPAQFAKAFRRHHGAPPSSFRGTWPPSRSPPAERCPAQGRHPRRLRRPREIDSRAVTPPQG